MKLLRIRKARLEDLERIVDFNIQMAEETEGKILDRNIVREGVKAILKNKAKGFYLLSEYNKSGKVLAGQLMVTFEWSDWRNRNIWWIQSVYVDKKYRNKKVFSRLYGTVTKMALSEESVGGLRLYVEKNNNSAKKVYESLGMEKTAYEIYEKSL
jgi:ribosomal protein S18 acetylase RimI-like enzyme